MRHNHGTYCNLLIGTFALYTGQPEIARRVLEAVPARIADQIEPDGKTPHELWRTRSFLYSTFNLNGLFQLAELAEPMGIDLWNYQTEDGRSIRRAIEWLAQYAPPDTKWPHPELDMNTHRPLLYSLVRRAHLKYHDPQFLRILLRIPAEERKNEISPLLWGEVERFQHAL